MLIDTRHLILGLLVLQAMLAAQDAPSVEVSSLVTIETGKTSASADEGAPSYPWRLASPRSGEGPFPLVVFLHGAGERGDDNERQWTYLPSQLVEKEAFPRRQAFVLAMQVPRGERWVDTDWSRPSGHRMSAKPTPVMAALIARIAELRRNPRVDQRRVYAVGLSMGGYGTWDLVARKPEWFAAMVPVCGGGDARQAPRLARVPAWVWHGDSDRIVPPSRSREMVGALLRIGARPRYSELRGVGHDSWTPAFGPNGALDWLFQQRQAASAARTGD